MSTVVALRRERPAEDFLIDVQGVAWIIIAPPDWHEDLKIGHSLVYSMEALRGLTSSTLASGVADILVTWNSIASYHGGGTATICSKAGGELELKPEVLRIFWEAGLTLRVVGE